MPGRSVRLDHSSLRSNTPDILAPPNRSITPRRVPTESRAEQLREMSGRPTDCRSPIYRPEDPDFPREQTRRNGPCRDKSSSRSKGYSQRAAMDYCASFPESCRAKRRRGGIEQRGLAGLAYIGESFRPDSVAGAHDVIVVDCTFTRFSALGSTPAHRAVLLHTDTTINCAPEGAVYR